MSENQKDFIPEEQDDFSSSTIFSAPSEHKDKKKAGKHGLTLRLIAIFLVVHICSVPPYGNIFVRISQT
jgi:hypothetical protein